MNKKIVFGVLGAAVAVAVGVKVAFFSDSSKNSADRLVKNFEAYLTESSAREMYSWDSVTALDNGMARLNNVVIKDNSSGKDVELKVKFLDIEKMEMSEKLVSQKLHLDDITLMDGKSPTQVFLEELKQYSELGYEGNLPPMDLSMDLVHDVEKNKTHTQVLFDQAMVGRFNILLDAHQLNEVVEFFKKNPKMSNDQMEQNMPQVMALILPVQLEKFRMELVDDGLIAKTRAQGKTIPKVEECQFGLMMLGAEVDASVCENLTAFLLGDKKSLVLELAPAKPFALSKFATLASPTPESINALLKELNFTVKN